MAPIIVRPTMKFVYLGYLATLVVVAALVLLLMRVPWPSAVPPAALPWIPWASVLLFLWPLRRQMRNRLTQMTILDFELRYETGLMGRTTRTVMLPRVQDVTVHQSVGQRLFGVGNLTIETAGEAGRLTMTNIDRPQKIADIVNQRSQTPYPVDPRV